MAHLGQPGADQSELDAEPAGLACADLDRDSPEDPQAVEETSPYVEIMLSEVEQQLVAEDEEESETVRQARREVDQKIVDRVRKDLEAGNDDLFKRLTNRLLGYALPILSAWVGSREIFGKVNTLRQQANRTLVQRGARQMPLIRSNNDDWQAWSKDDIDQIVIDLVDEGVTRFRRTVEAGQWDHSRGASLNTYFIGACLLSFEKVYRRWRKQKRLDRYARGVGLIEDLALIEPVFQPAFGRAPESQAVMVDEITRAMATIKDLQVRQLLWYQMQGYTQKDAAALVGLSPKAAEGRLGRIRRRLAADDVQRPPARTDGTER
ncbi:hypothetical protein Ssi03_36250 [Sphaerisporangium siamense]|uniref:Uncharacterized protein n=2 Tax=Sphaerisporangium siamense TaxID=795645 RepID=A0A7W7D7N4_9ACTN|nr:hypothetical protein [Sphaerisporangium siamense]MBB4701509.1 hypothetical protein [Sphaerisporangium siamense]GII85635.1 hypothetical protein Ssi03_36250 [Sphaerisporangium siamense]